MYASEKKIIKMAMLVLFLSLLLIYVLLYQIKGDKLKNKILAETGNSEQLWTPILTTTQNPDEDENNTTNTNETFYSNENIESYSATGTNKPKFTGRNASASDTDLINKVESWNSTTGTFVGFSGNEQIIDKEISTGALSWTKRYYWPIDSIEKLWISYQYALKDPKDIYYVFLWDFTINIDYIVRKLWGTTYSMVSEQEIIDNQLFWEKVTFINLPEYKDKLVIMIITLDDKQRLIQIGYPIYHQSKGYLKTLFLN